MEPSREKNIMGSEFSDPDEASYSLHLVRVKPISCQGGLLQDFPKGCTFLEGWVEVSCF